LPEVCDQRPVPDIFQEIARIRRERRLAALATVVSTKGSTPAKVTARMLVFPEGGILGTVGGGCVEADVIRSARDVIDTGSPRRMTFHLHGEEAERTGIACGGILEIMIESLEEPRVVLIGAGHVAQAVARLAARLDFRVTVVDDRPDFANRERFPDVDEIVVAELSDLARNVKVTRNCAVICMTRGHAEDLTALKFALTTPARYVGVLGSKGKRLQFREALAADGHAPAAIESLHMPVGLEIGAETVEEIAVAIVGELIKERRRTK
jgi:xanthine dehydrogenase accessory factor